jgi:hypothetical protein
MRSIMATVSFFPCARRSKGMGLAAFGADLLDQWREFVASRRVTQAT